MKRKCYGCARLFDEPDDALAKKPSGPDVRCPECSAKAPQAPQAESTEVTAEQMASLRAEAAERRATSPRPGMVPTSNGLGEAPYAERSTGLTELEAIEECLSSVLKVHEFLGRRVLELCAHVERLKRREEEALLVEVQNAAAKA